MTASRAMETTMNAKNHTHTRTPAALPSCSTSNWGRDMEMDISQAIREYGRLTAELAAMACAIADMHKRGTLDQEWLGMAIKEIRETEQKRTLIFQGATA